MAAIATEEGTHVVPDGTKLYTKTWKPTEQPRAILAFVHGFSDHCNAYYDLFPTLASHGIEVRALDQRGWGRSVTKPKDRGRTGPTAVVLSDMHSFLLSVNSLATEEDTPLFLLGHSMGGAQVLTYVLHPDSPFTTEPDPSKRPRLRGVMAYSPLVALHPSSRPSVLTVKAGRLAGKLLPKYQRYSALDPKLVSRDERVCADWAADELCHDYGTLEGLAGMLDRGLWLEGLSASTVENGLKSRDFPPMWFGHGTGDMVTDCEATKRLAAALGGAMDLTFRSYEGAYHKLHADLAHVRVQFAKDIAEWILARCPSSAQPVVSSTARETEETTPMNQGSEKVAQPVVTGDESNKAKL